MSVLGVQRQEFRVVALLLSIRPNDGLGKTPAPLSKPRWTVVPPRILGRSPPLSIRPNDGLGKSLAPLSKPRWTVVPEEEFRVVPPPLSIRPNDGLGKSLAPLSICRCTLHCKCFLCCALCARCPFWYGFYSTKRMSYETNAFANFWIFVDEEVRPRPMPSLYEGIWWHAACLGTARYPDFVRKMAIIKEQPMISRYEFLWWHAT